MLNKNSVSLIIFIFELVLVSAMIQPISAQEPVATPYAENAPAAIPYAENALVASQPSNAPSAPVSSNYSENAPLASCPAPSSYVTNASAITPDFTACIALVALFSVFAYLYYSKSQ